MAGAGETVTVACKMPHGLILRVFDMVDEYEPVMGGGSRTFKIARQRGESVTVHGVAAPFNERPAAQIVGGYALTQNVPLDFWTAWFEANKDSDYVKNKLIYARPKSENVEGWAKEHTKVRSGLEPLDVSRTTKNGRDVPSDPRIPSSISPSDRK